jgi:GGDEF domain-containing protein
MRRLRLSLILLLIFTGLALNVERLDIGSKENVVNLASFVYVLAGMAVVTTILIPGKWKLSTTIIVIFWIAVYLMIKIALSFNRPVLGGLYTYLSMAEIIVLVGSVILTRAVLVDLEQLEETVANITMSGISNRVKNLDAAADDINKEIIRSRRYSRPLGVIVIKIDQDKVQANLDHLSRDIYKTMMSHYSMSNLIRTLDKEIRRPDLILEHSKNNRIILLLPETDIKATQVVSGNIQKIAENGAKTPVEVGYAVFPDDAITFEDLVNKAENKIYGNGGTILIQGNNITDQAINDHIHTKSE